MMRCTSFPKSTSFSIRKTLKSKALFLHNAYNPLAEDAAVFSSFEEAEELYNQLFDYQQYD
jgi:hypothetical protein